MQRAAQSSADLVLDTEGACLLEGLVELALQKPLRFSVLLQAFRGLLL